MADNVVSKTDAPEPAADSDGTEPTAELEKKDEPVADDGGEGLSESEKDELYQYIKERLAKDACKDSEAETKTETKETTQDHAPTIAVQLDNTANGGSLAKMFAEMKKGR